MKENKRILGGERLELVGSSHEGITCVPGQVFGDFLSETFEGVEASADSSATLSKLMHVLKGLHDALLSLAKLVNIA